MTSLSPSDQASLNRQGIAAMCLAMAVFLANDTLIKMVGGHHGVFQVLFFRGVVASVLLSLYAWRSGAWAAHGLMPHASVLKRSGLDALASLSYMTGLINLPLANATAINLATPLFITVLAVFILREKVDVLRWLLILTGFAGVLLVVQPSTEGLNGYAWLCVLGTVLHALRDLATRRIPPSVPSILITHTNAVLVMAVTGLLALTQPWASMGLVDALWLCLAAVFMCGGYVMVVRATRHSDMSVVAPFRYTGLLYALVAGYLIWDDVPNSLACVGIALLVAAGWVMLQRERAKPI